MSEPFLGEVRMWATYYTPQNWANCDGQLIAITDNAALYSLLGTTYGGDGRVQFGIPNLKGRAPIHTATTSTWESIGRGQFGGVDRVTLNETTMPQHTHQLKANAGNGTTIFPIPTTPAPGEKMLSVADGGNFYGAATNLQALNENMISDAGAGQPHLNVQPSLAVRFAIAMNGLYPSRS